MGYRIWGYTHIGNSRKNHEDNLLIGKGIFLTNETVEKINNDRKMVCLESHSITDEFIAIVSDGMGGHERGEVASLEVVSYITSNYEYLMSAINIGEDEIISLFSDLNGVFNKKRYLDYGGINMGATLCGVVSNGRDYYCINAGDSRAYIFDNGELSQINVDNTEGQRLLDLGLLTSEEVNTFPKRKAIYKYIGLDGILIPDIYKLDSITEKTKFIICSDGLSDVIEKDEIKNMLNNRNIKTEDKGRFLVEIAEERHVGFGDNISLIIIERA